MKKNNFNSAIPEIERTLGYSFRDRSLLTQAFTRTSYCNENAGGYQSNEVLEFFGDGVLSVAIISFLLARMTERYEHGIRTELGEGDFSNIKSKLSDKKNLSLSMAALGLGKHLLMGEGDSKMGVVNEPSVLEDLFEAIIGAVYIDCDMSIPTVMRVVERMLDVSAYTSSTPPIQSAKNALQEWCDSKLRRLPHPVYSTVSESGPDHKKVYERAVSVGERTVATGKGKNTKIADAEAAAAALAILMAEESERGKTAKDVGRKGAAQTAASEPKPAPKAKPSDPKPTAKAKPSDSKPAAKAKPSEPKPAPKAKPSEPKPAPKAKPSDPKPAPKAKQTDSKSASLTRASAGSKATLRLKAFAKSKGMSSPIFKLISEGEGGACRIECRFGGDTAIGTGRSLLLAREDAAEKLLSSIKRRELLSTEAGARVRSSGGRTVKKKATSH